MNRKSFTTAFKQFQSPQTLPYKKKKKILIKQDVPSSIRNKLVKENSGSQWEKNLIKTPLSQVFTDRKPLEDTDVFKKIVTLKQNSHLKTPLTILAVHFRLMNMRSQTKVRKINIRLNLI